MLMRLWAVFALLLAGQVAADVAQPTRNLDLRPDQQQEQAAHLTADLLSRYHYQPVALDAAMSQRIFDHYLKALDPDRIFFSQADVDQWREAREQLGQAIVKEDLRIPFAVFNLYKQRAFENFGYARSLLAQGFDFGAQESYQYSRDDEPWPASPAEVHNLWRKRVKNDWLRLKLAGKDAKAIVETLDKRYDNSLKRVARLKTEDAFQSFMNAYTMSVEPHTNYMAPRAAEEFDISMKLSLSGIGAVLTERDDCAVVRELTPGGPAALSGRLKTGDRIVGVAQGASGAWTDIQGWRLDDAVALIRGEAGSVVRLDIIPAEHSRDGKHRQVSFVRQKISLEEQAAKKSVLTVSEGGSSRRIGVITLPVFYQDVESRQKGDANFKSATRDVARLLRELKKAQVDGVLVDLRNNGGGSLNEAVELTGLFIGNGPVVQERDARGNIHVERSAGARVAWSGPLGVLINRGSASASEIFAAAIQDYGRGVVIGEQSFGKGTVQTLVDLDKVAKNDKPLYGELKMTIAQFFRVDGGTTQLRGVSPDIAFPSLADPKYFGETSFDNALPWVQIRSADYSPLGDLKKLQPLLANRHDARIAKDRYFQLLQADIAEAKAEGRKSSVSLNEAERHGALLAEEAKLALRRQLAAGDSADDEADDEAAPRPDLKDDGLQSDERDLLGELKAAKARKKAKDVLLGEAAQIVADESELLATNADLALRARSAAPPPAQRQQGSAARNGIM